MRVYHLEIETCLELCVYSREYVQYHDDPPSTLLQDVDEVW